MAKIIKHYGMPRRSGRYPWGSGKDPQRNKDFLSYVSELKNQGLSDADIAKGLKVSSTELRAKRSIARSEQRAADAAMAQRLKDKGYSLVAIGKRMGKNESSIRSLLDPTLKEKANVTAATALTLKDAVDSKGFIDIGLGVENHLGVSRTKLNTAVSLLKEEGYTVHEVSVPQVGTGKMTNIKVLAPPGTTSLEVFKKRNEIKLVNAYSEDKGVSFISIEPPKNVSSDRIFVRYKEDGGKDKDGLIELKRGVDDISLGKNNYAQVRVAVDGTHFMKGMAAYSDNIPKGYDIVYNVGKNKGSSKDEIFKPLKDEPDNPFGAVIRQKHYIDKNGKEQLSALNIVNEEGDWTTWSRNLSSQVLSKQTPDLARKQLGLSLKLKQEEFDEIMGLTNPAVKKALLEPFADDADSSAVHLKAFALPRQSNHVIIPILSIKENEIYAPTFRSGENVVLIRHPHGGIFEIPQLRVNNKNIEGQKVVGPNSVDGVGIHPKVAQKLSGADFDGDTVIVIPNKNRDIQISDSLKSLKDFEPKLSYRPYDGMTTIDGGIYNEKTKKVDYGGKHPAKVNMQKKMGDVSNLITDMTIKGANQDEIARAIRHSMVVIDSEKHHLNYKQSYIDNNIVDLKKRYQGGPRAGASTLISRASSPLVLDERREGIYFKDPKTGKTKKVYIDPTTGKKLFEKTGRTYKETIKVKDPVTGKISYIETGKIIKKTVKSTKMAEAEDAFSLSSGTRMETVYANYANSLKGLANKARLAMISIPNVSYSPSARETYSEEVSILKSKLVKAFRNKPLERQAQLLANKIIAAKRRDNPDMDKDDIKKLKGQALEEARARYKAKKSDIVITDREWEAIQAGAISNNTLSRILANTDLKELKLRATPRSIRGMSDTKISKAKLMLNYGYTISEVADALGVPVSTLSSAISN